MGCLVTFLLDFSSTVVLVLGHGPLPKEVDTQKLINDPDAFFDEMLQGVILAHRSELRFIDWALLEETDDGYDVFGDGVLRSWHTQGHTLGHQSFEIHLPSGVAYFLTADAANMLDHLNEKVVPAFLVLASDMSASVRKIRWLIWRAQATAVAGRDAAQWATFKHAPDFYD
jgi:glyoxylase-like metal-dependent hydrolase (beta-lactamase superfamily II)